MPDTVSMKEFDSREAAAVALADEIEGLLRASVADHGEASLVVSGGASPIGLFRELSQRDLPWDRVWVIPSDERMVSINHPERNEAMIRRELLRDRARAAGLVTLLPSGPLPGSLLGNYDAAILGMGEDGHTASLFPDSPDLEEALASDKVLHQLDVPRLSARRVSLTPHALLHSHRLYLLFFGQAKRRVFDAAMAGGAVAEYPVRCLLQQDAVPVTVYWAP